MQILSHSSAYEKLRHGRAKCLAHSDRKLLMPRVTLYLPGNETRKDFLLKYYFTTTRTKVHSAFSAYFRQGKKNIDGNHDILDTWLTWVGYPNLSLLSFSVKWILHLPHLGGGRIKWKATKRSTQCPEYTRHSINVIL